ncbi:Leucine-rich_repeat domain superfamily [Hexamita inflata]|uniref:Leucine-rich_repeat domain superfamily n=1 Tax=Hexamita inflata TaxID=28002 RepID=A0ABP1HGT6_9EUKA
MQALKVDYSSPTIDLRNMGVQTLDLQQQLPHVNALILSDNQIQSYSFLSRFPNLRSLTADRANFTNKTFKLIPQYVQHLSLRDNQLQSIEFYSKYLQLLDISSNPIQYLNFQQFPVLRKLISSWSSKFALQQWLGPSSSSNQLLISNLQFSVRLISDNISFQARKTNSEPVLDKQIYLSVFCSVQNQTVCLKRIQIKLSQLDQCVFSLKKLCGAEGIVFSNCLFAVQIECGESGVYCFDLNGTVILGENIQNEKIIDKIELLPGVPKCGMPCTISNLVGAQQINWYCTVLTAQQIKQQIREINKFEHLEFYTDAFAHQVMINSNPVIMNSSVCLNMGSIQSELNLPLQLTHLQTSNHLQVPNSAKNKFILAEITFQSTKRTIFWPVPAEMQQIKTGIKMTFDAPNLVFTVKNEPENYQIIVFKNNIEIFRLKNQCTLNLVELIIEQSGFTNEEEFQRAGVILKLDGLYQAVLVVENDGIILQKEYAEDLYLKGDIGEAEGVKAETQV